MTFSDMQSGLAKYQKYKNIKSWKDHDLASTLKKIQDSNGWTPIPNRLLFNTHISHTSKILWAILQNLGDEYGYSSYSQESLAYFSGSKSVKTIQRHNNELIKKNWLKTSPSKKYPSNDSGVIWPPGLQNPKLKSAEDNYKNKSKKY